MCKLLKIVFSVFMYSMFPMLLLLCYTHRMCMVDGSTRGLFISIGIVGSLYVIVSASMCYYICVSKRTYVWCVILVPFVVRNGEYNNGIGVIFCC